MAITPSVVFPFEFRLSFPRLEHAHFFYLTRVDRPKRCDLSIRDAVEVDIRIARRGSGGGLKRRLPRETRNPGRSRLMTSYAEPPTPDFIISSRVRMRESV
jgi:hypothetical protein